MPKRPRRLKFDKEEPKPPRQAGAASGINRVIVKAKTPGYVPPGFTVRTRIDDVLFTAEASADAVAKAGEDPDVESVAVAERLDLIE